MLPVTIAFIAGLAARPLFTRARRAIEHRRLLSRLNPPGLTAWQRFIWLR